MRTGMATSSWARPRFFLIRILVVTQLQRGRIRAPAGSRSLELEDFFLPFKDQGEVMASWGEARLIKHLDGELVLKGGSKEDRIAAREWISMFLNGGVVREV
jgi:hypothetical protein